LLLVATVAVAFCCCLTSSASADGAFHVYGATEALSPTPTTPTGNVVFVSSGAATRSKGLAQRLFAVRGHFLATEESPLLNPADFAGQTPAEADQLARDSGLISKGPDPMNGRGSYIDPVTGEQRVLIHPDDPAGGHLHVNDPSGQRLDINGNPVNPNSPAAHLPIGFP
jgi:hypothetical protein